MKFRKLIFATNNPNKIEEIKAKVGKYYQVVSLKDLGENVDIPETGGTLEENAMIKANYLWTKTGSMSVSDDSGLEIDALNNEPGVYSARYAGIGKDSEKNIDKVLLKLKGVENRNAQFRTVIALIKGGKKYLFEGKIKGVITLDRKGTNGFGYDSIFQPEGYNKTFAELTLEEKNEISHRAIALNELILFLRK